MAGQKQNELDEKEEKRASFTAFGGFQPLVECTLLPLARSKELPL